MRDPEYDRFGPWAIEISAVDPPPPLFLPFLTRDDEPLLSVKIPRSIERRKAHAGMNLYDYMVTLYVDDLVVLQRVEDDVRAETFSYQKIQAIGYAENLLKGNLQLVMTDQVYNLPFNTVSKDLMRRMLALIRGRYISDTSTTTAMQGLASQREDLSFFFTNLLAEEMARTPDQRVLATQVDTAVGGYESGQVRRLLFGAIGKTLLESLHLCDGRELKIIDRGQACKYKWQTIYGVNETYVPVSNVLGATWAPDTSNAAIVNLNLETSGGSLSFALLKDNPSIAAYAHFLSMVAGPEPAAV
jgi:hypothetical protein